MKLFTTLFIGLVLSVTAFSQSLEIVQQERNYSMAADSSITNFFIGVRNKSTTPVRVRVRVDLTNLKSGHHTFFCFAAQCFNEGTIESTGEQGTTTIAPGDTDRTFLGDMLAEPGVNGVTRLTYTFFLDNNLNDNASIELTFNAGATAVGEDELLNLNASPNPAGDNVSFAFTQDFSLKAPSLYIVSPLGEQQEIAFSRMGSGRISIRTSDLANGTYVAVLRTDDKIFWKSKFVVLH